MTGETYAFVTSTWGGYSANGITRTINTRWVHKGKVVRIIRQENMGQISVEVEEGDNLTVPTKCLYVMSDAEVELWKLLQ